MKTTVYTDLTEAIGGTPLVRLQRTGAARGPRE